MPLTLRQIRKNCQAARETFARARTEHFALGAFNLDNQETLIAVARAASAKKAPVLVEVSKGEVDALGVRTDDVLMVHSSLKSLGWVIGGEVAVVQALLDAVGPLGTLVRGPAAAVVHAQHTENISESAQRDVDHRTRVLKNQERLLSGKDLA